MGNGQGKRGVAEHADLLAKLDDPEIKRLDLRSKNLDSLPQEITRLQNLTWLNLPNNNFTVLPEPLFELRALQTLRLLGNRLSDLPPGLGNLVALSSLDLSKNDFVEINDNIGALTSLTDLNLHWNIIETISPQLSKLTKLKTLNASLNALSQLPPMPRFTLLETLDLSHNRLHDVPPSCKEMAKLGSLNLAGNRLMQITGATLLGLSQLRTLDLQGNELKSLPPELGALAQLKYLRLRSNQLTELPAALTQLTALVELGASQNFLMSLPAGIGALTSLQTLHVYHNALEALPDDVGSLSSLRELGIAWNSIKTLPTSLGQLSQLAMLFANHNALTTLSDSSFSGLVKLQELTLNNNAIECLPATLTGLTDLRKLDASSNRLRSVPDTSVLPQLSWLELAHNELSKVPMTLCNTTVLTTLNLFANKLVSVPPELGQLVLLKKLYLGYNLLDDQGLPPESALARLTALEELFLSGNKFTAMPSQLRVLTTLTELDLSNNVLGSLDGDTLGALSNLKHLHLTCCHLTSLPDEIGALTALVELDLAHNALKTLPEAMGACTALTDLDVSGNLLEALPRSFEQRCVDMRQFKGAYNRFSRVPVFEQSRSQPPDHLWLSLAGNERLPISATDPSVVTSVSSSGAGSNGGGDTEGSEWSHSESVGMVTRPRSNTASSGAISAADFSDGALERATAHQQRLVGWAEMCGRRPDMQDTLVVHLNFRGQLQRSLVGLFDGHSGEKSAELVCNMLHGVVVRRLNAAEQGIILPDDAEAEARKARELELRPKMRRGKARELIEDESDDEHDVSVVKTEKERNALLHGEPVRKGRLRDDKGKGKGTVKSTRGKDISRTRFESPLLRKEPPDLSKPLPELDMVRVLTGTFRELHGAITKRRIADGTAALVMLVEHDHRRLIIANSGDERAVLARGNKAVQLTTDHKPEEPSEKVRVYDCGGFVNEQKRVDGILSLSRALGDNDLQPHVTYEPEVYTVELNSDDQFVILACDGLWDVVTNEQAVSVASRYANPAEAATALRDYAHMLGSTDNISVIVYRLDQEKVKDKEHKPEVKEGRSSKEGKERESKEERAAKRHSKRLSELLPEGSTPSKTPSKRATKLYPPSGQSSSTTTEGESPKKSSSTSHGRKTSSATTQQQQLKTSPRERGKDD